MKLIIKTTYDVEKSNFGELQKRYPTDGYKQCDTYFMENKNDSINMVMTERYYIQEQHKHKMCYILTNKDKQYEWKNES